MEKEKIMLAMRQGLRGENLTETFEGNSILCKEGVVNLDFDTGKATMSYDNPPQIIEGTIDKDVLAMMRRARATVRDKEYQRRCKLGITNPRQGGIKVAKVIRITSDMTEEQALALIRAQRNEIAEAKAKAKERLEAQVAKAKEAYEKALAALEAFEV